MNIINYTAARISVTERAMELEQNQNVAHNQMETTVMVLKVLLYI